MFKLFIIFSLLGSVSCFAADQWDHTPMYFWNESLPVSVAVIELRPLTAANWRVCRGLRKQAVQVVEHLNNPRLGDQVIPLRHNFHVLWANCSNIQSGGRESRGALRTHEYTGEVDLAAVSANFVPSFQKARSVIVELSHEDGTKEILEEVAPGAIFDIAYLREVKRLRLTPKGLSFIEQHSRLGKSLKFKITSSFEASKLEIPSSYLVDSTDVSVSNSMSLITCAGTVVGR